MSTSNNRFSVPSQTKRARFSFTPPDISKTKRNSGGISLVFGTIHAFHAIAGATSPLRLVNCTRRIMLYTRFIIPILTFARSRPIVRTQCPPICACAPKTCSTRDLTWDFSWLSAFCFSLSGCPRLPFSQIWLGMFCCANSAGIMPAPVERIGQNTCLRRE